MKLEIEIDGSCKYCIEGKRYFDKLQTTKNKDFYMSFDKKNNRQIKPLIIRPDFNSCGILTHWHIDKLQE